jgi:ferredoxin--NADP+ reductase
MPAHNATLIERQDLTNTLSIVKVRPDAGTVPPFHPGQFIRLGLPRPMTPEGAGGLRLSRPGRIRYTRRAYSIASAPTVTDHMEFFVVRIEAGALTPRLWELAVGERLWMDSEAKGEFSLDVAPPDKDAVMVSTSTGIAPFMSMLRTYRGQGRWRRLVLINGVRRAADFGYRAEMEAIARDDPSLVYVPLVTREPVGAAWTGLRGRVQTVLEPETYRRVVGAPLDPAECHVFLCGNPDMIDDVQKLLESRGFVTDSRAGRGNIHFERFW